MVEKEKWLETLDGRSRADQDRFIQGIANKLGRPRITEKPAHPYRGASDSWKAFEWPIEERITNFTANFQAAGGYVDRVSSMQEAKAKIKELIETLSVKRVIHQNQDELRALEIHQALPGVSTKVWNTDDETSWKAAAAAADLGIVIAESCSGLHWLDNCVIIRRKGQIR